MTIVEKNFKEWAEESGYKDYLINLGFEIGFKKGFEIGFEKGIEKCMENNIEIIHVMYKSNYSIEEIIRLTRLSKEKVLNVINKIKESKNK